METEIPGLSWDELKLRGFKVHELPTSVDVPVKTGRRDFYKMGLLNGDMTIDYSGQLVEVKGTVLFFVNPKVPHSIVRRVNRTSGYACIFTESFMNSREMQDSPLFSVGDNPHKADLIKSCIALVIHEALRIQPSQQTNPFKNGAGRLTHLFTDLLERQFPIERSNDPLRLRTAQDFAAGLSVHVNYLNRAVKEVTGKSTSAHIAARVTAEAKALLQHTDWSVADIAYALGFEYPAYFNNYFKRVTERTPNSFRKV
jgi:AraC family transcriptional activator of pobA